MSRLDEIVAWKHREVAQLRERTSERDLNAAAQRAPAVRGFRRALVETRPAVIAEVKRASPSRGTLVAEFDAPSVAQAYERGGASAVSVLTDQKFFAGSNGDLTAVREAVTLPVLRKDFVVDPLQIAEARSIGADAILLIVRVLDDRSLRSLRELAASFGMDAVVEAHDAQEVRRAVDSGATIIGVNNRDLSSFQVDLATSERLRPLIPEGILAVSESGIADASDAARMFQAGFDAVLVGESLVTAPEHAAAVRRLKLDARAGSVH